MLLELINFRVKIDFLELNFTNLIKENLLSHE